MKKFKGVVFDFNGTLFSDSAFHAEAWLRYTRDVMKRPVTKEFYFTEMHGRSNPEIYRSLYGKEIPKEMYKTWGSDKEQIYRDICLEHAPLGFVPGAEDYINYLNENGIPNMIATSSELVNMTFFRKHLPVDKYFGGKLVYDDGTVPGKPNPDIYLLAAKTLNIAPNDLVVFEDSHGGILAAKAAGIGYIVGVAENGIENFTDTKNVDAVIENFTTAPKNLF